MFKFALKNLLIKKVQTILIILSIMVSAGVAVLSYNVSNQVSDGLTNNAQYYSLIIGPSGSSAQLAMNTMYFTDEPLGTIPYSIKQELQMNSNVRKVIPFAMADQYNSYKIVGTESSYLESKDLKEGRMFDDTAIFEVVVGYNVANVCDLKINQEIYTSHSVGEEHHTPFKVVGILDKTYSSFDNVVFTQIRSIWEVHEHEEEHEEEEHEHMDNMVCAFLVSTTTPTAAMQIESIYDGKIISYDDGEDIENYTLQAIEPMAVMRNVLEDTDQTKYIVYALALIILLMNILVISIITLLNMYQSAKEIKLMRLIGVSMKKINLLYLIQNAIIGLFAVILAFILSKIGLLAMSSYASNMGVVLNYSKVYNVEIVILLGVFIINVLPTLIWTLVMSRKDGLD